MCSQGLKRYGFETPKEYLFRVVQTTENPEIYFEGRAIEELKKDNNTVKSVRLIPQYELKVTL